MEIQRQPRVKSWTLVLLLKQGTPCKASIWIFSGGWAPSVSLGNKNLQQGTLLSGSCYGITWWSRGYPVHSPPNRIRRGSRRASFISLGLSHPPVSRSGGLTSKPFLTLGKQRWIPQRKQVQRSWSHQNQKTYLFSLETNILLCVIAYLHLWHRYFRETFCNFSALGNWTQGFMHARQVLYYTQLHLSLWTF